MLVKSFVLLNLLNLVKANLRCYSCAPCNEFEIYAGDITHFEQDCYLDRYCMKVIVNHTVWKFHDFYISQILREINVGNSTFYKCKICHSNTFRGSEFCFLGIFALFEL